MSASKPTDVVAPPPTPGVEEEPRIAKKLSPWAAAGIVALVVAAVVAVVVASLSTYESIDHDPNEPPTLSEGG